MIRKRMMNIPEVEEDLEAEEEVLVEEEVEEEAKEVAPEVEKEEELEAVAEVEMEVEEVVEEEELRKEHPELRKMQQSEVKLERQRTIDLSHLGEEALAREEVEGVEEEEITLLLDPERKPLLNKIKS